MSCKIFQVGSLKKWRISKLIDVDGGEESIEGEIIVILKLR